MHIFITGGTGYVGSHIIRELLAGGHTVTALTRREDTPEQTGVQWIQGTLDDLPKLSKHVEAADAIIHAAMEYKDGAEASEQDKAAVRALLETNKFLVMTGNLYSCARDENGAIEEALEVSPGNWRNTVETAVVQSKYGGASIRLGFVYGGTGGYLWDIFEPCADDLVFYTGDGTATWPMVHVEDVARLYRLVVEARSSGVFHAWDNTPLSIKGLLETIANVRGATAVEIPFEEAREKLGGFADRMLTTIAPHAGAASKVGWKPLHASFTDAAKQAFTDRQAARLKATT